MAQKQHSNGIENGEPSKSNENILDPAFANQAATANQAAAPVQPTPNFQAGVGADNSVPVVDNAAVLQIQAMIFSQLAQQQQLTTAAANAPNSDMSNTANANANANSNASKKRKSPP